MFEKKKNPRWFNVLKNLFLILGFAGIIVIAVFPFKSRNLNIHFITKDNIDYLVEVSSEDISSNTCSEIKIQNLGVDTKITKLQIYGNSKTMVLSDINYNKIFTFLDLDKNPEVNLQEDGVNIGNTNVLYFTEGFVNELRRLSKSFLQERIIIAGAIGCLVLTLLIVITAIKDWKDESNRDNHSPAYEFKHFFTDVAKYWDYMVFAARADLKSEVANSYLNRLWWLLEPFLSMMVYVLVFGRMMGNDVENYVTFVFSALLMWNYFSKILNFSVRLVRSNRDILGKIYIPKFVLLISNMILNLIKLAFSLIILIPMLLIFRVHIGSNVFMIIPAYLIMILLSFGVGMILLHFGVYVDDLGYAVGILLNMMMFLSGIFYNVNTSLSYPLNVLMKCINPMAMCIDTMRNGLLYNVCSNMPLVCVWLFASLLICWLGVHTVYKYENSYVKMV